MLHLHAPNYPVYYLDGPPNICSSEFPHWFHHQLPLVDDVHHHLLSFGYFEEYTIALAPVYEVVMIPLDHSAVICIFVDVAAGEL